MGSASVTRKLPLPLLSLLLTGCAFGYRVGPGFNISTRNEIGFHLTASIGGGVAARKRHAVMAMPELGVGMVFDPKGEGYQWFPTGFVGGGFDYVHPRFGRSKVGMRVGIRGRFLMMMDRSGPLDLVGGVGLATAVLPLVKTRSRGGGRQHWSVSVELQSYVMHQSGDWFGWFFLTPYFENNILWRR